MIKLTEDQAESLYENRSLALAIAALLESEIELLIKEMATTEMDPQKLLIARARIDGARSLVGNYARSIRSINRRE